MLSVASYLFLGVDLKITMLKGQVMKIREILRLHLHGRHPPLFPVPLFLHLSLHIAESASV